MRIMGIYVVYTRVSKTNGEFTEVVVMNIEARNAAAAEHRILDNFHTIDNALAFDMETEAEFAAPYMKTSKCLDYADFAKRYKLMMNHRQECIDNQLDEIAYVEGENKKSREEIAKLEWQIKKLRELIANNDEYIKECKDELNEYCKNVRMKAEHSADVYVIGIA